MNNYDNNYERSINNYDDGYDSGRKDRQRNNLREALLGAMRSAKPDGGIGDQEMDRAKRARNMEIGGMAGSVVPVVGAPVGQIYGAQHDDLVKGAGQGLTTASEISPLVLGMGTFGTSMLAPAAMKAWKEKLWSKADPGLRKTFRDMDPSRGVKKLAKNLGISW